jgi:wyosine [tRNA(Phe)-imidazoG37] synthetase (radical SAM superfamily)
MLYEIIANNFAPKRRNLKGESQSHSVGYGFCTFKCVFCVFKQRPERCYVPYDDEAFDKLLDELFKTSKNFKFTGGEPTLNPKIIDHLSNVKKRGGFVYFDSNGSNPDVIEKLLHLKLIDVLCISLKGVTKEEAVQVSRSYSTLVWDNVFNTLQIAGSYKKVHIIVTLVFTEANYKGRIDTFADLIKDIPNVQLKVNNLQGDDHKPNAYELISVQPDELIDEIEKFVAKKPEWQGRTILINTLDAISDYSKIQFY